MDQHKKQNMYSSLKCVLENKIKVHKFWISQGMEWPTLRELANRVFSLVPSTASSKRNFSTFGFVHSRLRNCLLQESVMKLVNIKCNVPIYLSKKQEDNNLE